MSNIAAVRTGAIALLIGATCLSAAPEARQSSNGAQRLAWLAGCWERTSGAAHDFPQRIIYRRRGADSLIARIEGVRGGQVRGVDFPYRRAACP